MTTRRPDHPRTGDARRGSRALRRGAAVTALATGLLLVAGPAYADEVPDGWESSHVSLLQALTVFVFAPLGVALVIVLLVAAPWLRRGEGLGGDPEARHRAEPEESPELTAGPGEEPRRRLES